MPTYFKHETKHSSSRVRCKAVKQQTRPPRFPASPIRRTYDALLFSPPSVVLEKGGRGNAVAVARFLSLVHASTENIKHSFHEQGGRPNQGYVFRYIVAMRKPTLIVTPQFPPVVSDVYGGSRDIVVVLFCHEVTNDFIRNERKRLQQEVDILRDQFAQLWPCLCEPLCLARWDWQPQQQLLFAASPHAFPPLSLSVSALLG